MITTFVVAQMVVAQMGATIDWTNPYTPPLAEVKQVVKQVDYRPLADAFPKTKPRKTKPVITSQVIMVTQANCPPCTQALAECIRAGVRFGASRTAKYRLMDINDAGRYGVQQTPTFIVLANGSETARYDAFPGVIPLKKAYSAATKQASSAAKATASAPASASMAMGDAPVKATADAVRQWASVIMGETGDITLSWARDKSATIPLGSDGGLSVTIPKNMKVRYKWANQNLSMGFVNGRPGLKKRGVPFTLGIAGMTLTPTSIKLQIDWISDPVWKLTD
jgi:hypothetical protein